MIRHGVKFALSEAFCIGPVLLIRLAQNRRNFLELVHLAAAREEWLEGVELSHDTAQGEDVHRVVVGPTPEHVFGGAVPPCGDIFSEGGRMPDLFYETEVTYFYNVLFLNENVLWLDIPVEEAMGVDVVER